MYKYENTNDVILHNRDNCDTYYTSSTHTFPYWSYMVLVTELALSSLQLRGK